MLAIVGESNRHRSAQDGQSQAQTHLCWLNAVNEEGAMRGPIILASLWLGITAHPGLAGSLSDCSRARNADLRLRTCSAIIASTAATPEDKATAYRNRGNARGRWRQ